MKYIRFLKNNSECCGVLNGETISALDGNFLSESPKLTGEVFKLSEVKLLPPVNPGQLIAIGLNYALHAKESGKSIPEEPMMFMVSPTAVVADGEEISLPNLEHRIDYEAELAVVIGKQAKDVRKELALEYVFGYTICNDISDRNLQKNDGQFTRAKSFATFKPLGPVIETDLNPNNVEIKLSVNGIVKQQSNTNDLIHDIESLIVKVTEVMTLNPGDIIITGTPSGVGPLKPGDQVAIEIEGIGKLMNNVVDGTKKVLQTTDESQLAK
ncbi:2-keto-4-pentenoate hydratase/2-oxohepta-3-ene-1,7-dioic acid hydratase (catechol pathway) [Mesobacillus persicus]|uniref:2-keto-4-pentenoate hydratase/2-oxohepta-3-ene-1,7-dioic acid hydratase (Catechol pathway) n=1 Tax=Mesobacillus persicus TaxID=930146 RepID=A0A1H8D856_9BACI|nr:fumarylacetoacetate hydrolase family protein [Mesobacillus persicus]SEN03326.1 2-keto-4-pentenoate hydratase/2-oxohepta-3-ene-1,7-dioic acid hydratase (catechol pathway) [Mesobacillus persicus]